MPIPDNSEFYLYGIKFNVLADGYEKGINNSGPWRKVKLLCDWGDSDNLIDALAGVGQYVSVGSQWVARNPWTYPYNSLLRVMEVSAIPIGAAIPDPKLYASDLCALSVSFGVPEFSVDGFAYQSFTNNIAVPWSKVEIDVGIEEYAASDLTLPATGDTAKNAKVILPVQTITFRRANIPFFNEYQAMVASFVGQLNSGAFFGYAGGTVRLESFSCREGDRDPSGFILYEFDIVFRQRPIDWNMELVPGTARTWDFAQDGGGNNRYLYSDFSPLVEYGVIF